MRVKKREVTHRDRKPWSRKFSPLSFPSFLSDPPLQTAAGVQLLTEGAGGPGPAPPQSAEA